jgi:hypothetical protein
MLVIRKQHGQRGKRWASRTAISARLVAIELTTWRSALAGTSARHEAFG